MAEAVRYIYIYIYIQVKICNYHYILYILYIFKLKSVTIIFSPTRESAGLSGGVKFGSKSLPPDQSVNKELFQKHVRSHCRPREDDEFSNHLLPKDRRIKAMTLFNSAIQSFNAGLQCSL